MKWLKVKKIQSLNIYTNLSWIACFYVEQKNQLEKIWIPEADSKIFVQKRVVLETNWKKYLLNQPFFVWLENGFVSDLRLLWAVQMSCLN